MLTWKIFKGVDDYIIVHADTFAEALKKARLRDLAYNAGYVVHDYED